MNHTPETTKRGEKPEYYPHGKNSTPKTALSLFGNHLIGLVVALFVCIFLARIMVGNGIWVGAPIVFLVYCCMTYGSLWHLGHDDANLANFGHITLDPWRGLKLSLIVLAPFFAFGLFFIVCCLLEVEWFSSLAIAYRVVNANVWPLINAVTPVAEEGAAAINVWPIGRAVAAGLFPVLPIFVHPVAYYLGTRDFSILQWLIYKKKPGDGKNGSKPTKTR